MGNSEWQFARAEETLSSAEALRRANKDWPNVYYLSGLAAEHALWAIRMKRAGLSKPDQQQSGAAHDLSKIAIHCGLESAIKTEIKGNRAFHINWRTVCDWDSNARFQKVATEDAKDIFLAMNNPSNGVMRWLRNIYQTI